jgi:serine/threonine protein kinase
LERLSRGGNQGWFKRQDDDRVLEPLSETIRQILLELTLCSAVDLRRCRHLVRNLAYDLPAFDSVWLDALVQIGRLTPFQARILESANPNNIRIGPFVAVQRIGGGCFGQTLLARPIDSKNKFVVKHLTATDRLSAETVDRLESLVAAGRRVQHPSIVAPVSGIWTGNSYYLVSRFVPGSHLAELVVRRGRFPATIVWEIGRQLAEGLDALTQAGLTHGDIRLANVRLTSTGDTVLVDAGVRPAIDPALTIHSGFAPERYDGIAPELVGVDGHHCVATDAYALGCLMWQLLAGRPPFPGGDALIKLAAHQSRRVEDVRKWAPEVPASLADGISRLTSWNPADRPTSFADILSVWGQPNRSGRNRLAAFRRRFDIPVRNHAARRPFSAVTRWLFVAATLFAVSGGVAALVSQGARNELLSWGSVISQRFQRQAPSTRNDSESDKVISGATTHANTKYLPLPAPDRHGVVHLDLPGPYQARDLTAVGALSIVGDETAVPRIVVGNQPFKLCAETLRLKNLQIVLENRTTGIASNLRAVLRAECQSLTIESCLFDAGGWNTVLPDAVALRNVAPPSGPALIAWKLVDGGDPRAGIATIRQSVLLGDGPALYLANAVRQVACENLLKVGPGPLVQLAAAPNPKSTIALKLNHATLRAAGALVRWLVPESATLSPASFERNRGTILIEANDSVLDVASPQAALFELAGALPREEWLQWLQMTGEGSITRPAVEVAAWVSTLDGGISELAANALQIEGLAAGDFGFAGNISNRPVNSEVRNSDAPRRSAALPGIHAADLPH